MQKQSHTKEDLTKNYVLKVTAALRPWYRAEACACEVTPAYR